MKTIWYHGSDKKIDVFNPYAFDLGNTFQKFGWSTFCFKDYDYTKKFCIMRCIQRYYSEIKTDDNRNFLHINRCTWDFVNEKPITTLDGLDFIIKKLKGTKIFIHYIDTSKLKIKGIGNDVTHDEFTFRDKNIVPIKIETITFTKKLLEDNIMIVNDVNKYRDKLVEISNYYNRGFLSLFITYDYTLNRREIEKIIVSIEKGKIKIGDDIHKYVIENDIRIVKIPLLKRIKKSFLGMINKKIFRKKYIEILKKYNDNLKYIEYF